MIRFLFDFVSPYSYLAATQIRGLAAQHGHDVEPVPVLFAGLLNATGGRGPAEIPAKRDYMFRDIVRLARALGVPLAPPASHPFNPLAALRVAGCVDGDRWRLVDALFAAAWARGLAIDRPEVIAQVADEAGADGAGLLAAASTPAAKDRLRTATDAAIGAGAFGVPTMLVDGELFWGVDSLPLLARFLGGEVITGIDAWRRVEPSASR